MTEAFPLLSAALEQPFEARTPAEDVGHMLDALGLLGSSYHSFDPPAPVPASPAPQAAVSPDPVHALQEPPRPAEDEATLPLEPMPTQMSLPRGEMRGPDYAGMPQFKDRRDLPSQTRREKNIASEAPRVAPASSISLREMFQTIGSSPGASRRRLRQVFSQRGRGL